MHLIFIISVSKHLLHSHLHSVVQVQIMLKCLLFVNTNVFWTENIEFTFSTEIPYLFQLDRSET